VVITYKTIQEGKTEYLTQKYYSNIYNKTIPRNESVIFNNNGYDYIMHSYILRPRNIFLGNENTYLNTKNYCKLLKKQNIKWMITSKNIGLNFELPNYNLQLTKTIPQNINNSQFYIYKLKTTQNCIN